MLPVPENLLAENPNLLASLTVSLKPLGWPKFIKTKDCFVSIPHPFSPKNEGFLPL